MEIYAEEGANVEVGADLCKLELKAGAESAASKPSATQPKQPETKSETLSQPKQSGATSTQPKQSEANSTQPKKTEPEPKKEISVNASKPITTEGKVETPYGKGTASAIGPDRIEYRIEMSRMRSRIAERLKESQKIAASLTTFNEVDMTSLVGLRGKCKEEVMKKHGVKLGFMGAFMKACSVALMEIPEVNARIEGNEIVYNDFVDISVAVATPKVFVEFT